MLTRGDSIRDAFGEAQRGHSISVTSLIAGILSLSSIYMLFM